MKNFTFLLIFLIINSLFISGADVPVIYKKDVIRFDKTQPYGSKTNWREILIRDEGYSICADSRGRVYISDKKECKVHIFAKDGRHVKSFGRLGEGPGDFQYPGGITIYRDKWLVIMEAKFYRSISIHDLNGSFVKKIRLDQAADKAFLLEDNHLAIISEGLRTVNKDLRKLRILGFVYSIKNDNAEEMKNLEKPAEYFMFGREGAVNPEINFYGELGIAVTPNQELIIGDSDSDILEVFDKDFNLKVKIPLNLKKLKNTSDYIKACKEKVIANKKEEFESKPGFSKAYRDWDIKTSCLPYYRKFKVDDRGNIIVFVNDCNIKPKTQQIRVYSPTGILLKTLKINTQNFELDYNSYTFFLRDFFVFTAKGIFALLPGIDEDGDINYRVYKSN